MLELKKTPEHTIDRVFLLALLALFAATAFLVVSIGAKPVSYTHLSSVQPG